MRSTTGKCELCGGDCHVQALGDRLSTVFECPACGTFTITEEACHELNCYSNTVRNCVRCYVRQRDGPHVTVGTVDLCADCWGERAVISPYRP